MNDFRGEIRTQMNDFRGEIRTQMNDFRGEMQVQTSTFRKEMQQQVGNFREEMQEMRGDIHTIGAVLRNVVSHLSGESNFKKFHFGKMHNSLDKFSVNSNPQPSNTVSQSPLALSDTGKRKLHDSGLKDGIDAHREQLLQDLDTKLEGSDNRFDIQLQSLYVIDDFLAKEKDLAGTIKEYAFDEGIGNLQEFVDVGAVYLRDAYFKDRNIVVMDKKGGGESA